MTKVKGLRDIDFYIPQTEAEFNAITGQERFKVIPTYKDEAMTIKGPSQAPWCLSICKEIAKEEKKKGKK